MNSDANLFTAHPPPPHNPSSPLPPHTQHLPPPSLDENTNVVLSFSTGLGNLGRLRKTKTKICQKQATAPLFWGEEVKLKK